MRYLLMLSYRVLAASLLIWTVIATPAQATNLNIAPVAQQESQWCWAASAGMVLRHLGVPNLDPTGNYQCGVVSAQGGFCFGNCRACSQPGGTTQRIAAVIRSYLAFAGRMTGYRNSAIVVQSRGIMTPAEIAAHIDHGTPIIAGISPNGVGFPSGYGISEHVVVIEGYNGNVAARKFKLLVNDPMPPNRAWWLWLGADELRPGQYQIRYSTFVGHMLYRNSITFE